MSEIVLLSMTSMSASARSRSIFLDRYLEESGDYMRASMLDLYRVYRSLVRAKEAKHMLMREDFMLPSMYSLSGGFSEPSARGLE